MLDVAFGGEADIPRAPGPCRSDENDPTWGFTSQFCCDAQTRHSHSDVVGCDTRAEEAHEAPQVPHAGRQRGGLAALSARTAGNPGGGIPEQPVARRVD